jgi:hypothetical protein
MFDSVRWFRCAAPASLPRAAATVASAEGSACAKIHNRPANHQPARRRRNARRLTHTKVQLARPQHVPVSTKREPECKRTPQPRRRHFGLGTPAGAQENFSEYRSVRPPSVVSTMRQEVAIGDHASDHTTGRRAQAKSDEDDSHRRSEGITQHHGEAPDRDREDRKGLAAERLAKPAPSWFCRAMQATR